MERAQECLPDFKLFNGRDVVSQAVLLTSLASTSVKEPCAVVSPTPSARSSASPEPVGCAVRSSRLSKVTSSEVDSSDSVNDKNDASDVANDKEDASSSLAQADGTSRLATERLPDAPNVGTHRKRGRKRQEPVSTSYKPLLPRLPAPMVPASNVRLPTPPGPTSTPHTPHSPPHEQPSCPASPTCAQAPQPLSQSPSQPPSQSSSLPQLAPANDLMPMLLQAAAQAAVRDKRQERMVKNRAAAYESRKRKREEAERLMRENSEMRCRLEELERRVDELSRDRDAIEVENKRLRLELESRDLSEA